MEPVVEESAVTTVAPEDVVFNSVNPNAVLEPLAKVDYQGIEDRTHKALEDLLKLLDGQRWNRFVGPEGRNLSARYEHWKMLYADVVQSVLNPLNF